MATLAARQGDAIQLSEEPDFTLGTMHVAPALRRVRWGAETRMLEPRVMQVLIALARQPGAIVNRDALVERCWGGRIVGENAIQRPISLLRHLAAESGAFTVETITKVGYRLLAVVPEPAAAAPILEPSALSSSPRLDRRAVLGGGAVLLAGSAAWGLWSPAARASREARRLHAAGVETQRRGGPQNVHQAVAFFERAAAADPGFADAWADLAYARFELMEAAYEEEHERIAFKVQAAANRALALDPRSRNALVALALHRPPFRRWAAAEVVLQRTLEQLPGDPLLLQRQGLLLGDVGRWRAAARIFEELVRREPLVPDHQLSLASAHWHAGDLGSANMLFDRASKLWPIEIGPWLTRFNFLLLSGRPKAAVQMTQRLAVGLGGKSPLPAAVATATAQALISGAPGDREVAVKRLQASRKAGEIASFLAIPYLTALGAVETAWPMLFDFYFGPRDRGTGRRRAPNSFAWRRTNFLFTATMAPVRADARFAHLTERLGLQDYWRSTRTRPDTA